VCEDVFTEVFEQMFTDFLEKTTPPGDFHEKAHPILEKAHHCGEVAHPCSILPCLLYWKT
jgi:hypothetical protein